MSLKMTDSYTASLKESIMICNDLKAIINHKNSVSGGGTGNNNSQIQEIDAYLSQLEKDLSFAPYNKHLDTIEYLEFCNNYDPKTATEAGDPYAEIEQFCGDLITGGLSYKTYYETYYSKASSNFKFKNGNDEEWHEVMFNLAYMNEDELNMYHYIFNTEGKDAAEKYIDLIQDELIQRCGTEGAFAYINALERDDINFGDYMLEHGDVDGDGKVTINDISLLQSNIKDNKDCSTYDVDGDGKVDSGDVSLLQRYVAGDETLEEDIDYKPLSDSAVNNFMTILAGYDGGIQGYCEGLYNALHDNESFTVEEYKNAIILQYLLKKDPDLARKYKISSAIGNMTIPVTASVLVSIATENPEVGRKVGSVLMGASAFGNAKHQALVEGHDKISSYSYGALTGLSETISDYMLSGIPGLGKATGFNVLSVGKEMVQEGLQEYMDAGFRYVCFGETFDLGELSGDALDAAINGGIVALIMNGGNATVHFTIEGVDYVVEGGKLTDLVSQKARGFTINDILGIAVVDLNVTQFSNKYNCSLEEATTMLSVINATSETQRAEAVSKLSNDDMCKLILHLKNTENTKVYNQVLAQMTSEQYVALAGSGVLSENQLNQLKRDMGSLRKKIGSGMKSSEAEIRQIYKDNWVNNTMNKMNVSECVASNVYDYYINASNKGQKVTLSPYVYTIMEDSVYNYSMPDSEGVYTNHQKTTISVANAQKLVDSIGADKFKEIYPKIKDYCREGEDGGPIQTLFSLHEKDGLSWDKIAEAYSCRDVSFEGPIYDVSSSTEKLLNGKNSNSNIYDGMKLAFDSSGLKISDFALNVRDTVIKDIPNITHVEEYLKLVHGEVSIDEITAKNEDGTYIYDDIVSSEFFTNYLDVDFINEVSSINSTIDAELKTLDPARPDYSYKSAMIEDKRNKMIKLAKLLRNTSVDVDDPMSTLTADQKLQVTDYSKMIQNNAKSHEATITADMKSLEDKTGSHLEGLSHNIKSLDSLNSKLARKLAQGYELKDAVKDVNDSLRYTLIVDENSYESTVKTKLASLVKKGYKIDHWNDAWGGDIYQGLNITLKAPDGMLVELQFHTEDSFKVKESLNHDYYNISRNPAMDSEIIETSNAIQRINQQLYVRNVGFGFNSSTVTEINQMANQIVDQKLISFTNVSSAGPFDSQVNAYKAAHPECDLVPGTDIPKALVISDIYYIYQVGNGDLSAGLKAISNKFGEYSVQAVTARATVFQESFYLSTYNSVDYEGLATYFTDLYSTAGIQGFDNTLEMGKAGYDIGDKVDCTNWLSKKYSSDISAWERLKKQPGGLFGMHYFTDNSSFGAAFRMRNDKGYNSYDIQAIQQLSSQYDKSSNSGLNGLGERTMIYRGIDIPTWIPGVDGSMSQSDVVSTLNSLATGTVVMGDNAFQSGTPVLGQGFTAKGRKDYVEVCSCPPGTEGAYLGEYAAFGYGEVEYNLQAGSGNRKIILGAKEIDGQVFIFTEMIPESEAVNSTATSALLDVDIDSSVPTFTSESDLQTYIKSLYKTSDPDITLATKTVLKYIQDKASSSKMSGALYYEFLSMYDTGLDSTQNAALLTNVINSSSELRQAIRDNALSEIKSTFGDRFGFSDAKCEELLNTLLGKDFVNCGVGAGINWEGFRTEMRAAIRSKVQDGIRSGKEAVIWSGFDDETHDTMDSKYTTISNTSIGGLTFLESVYMNWNSEATAQKASTLWGIMSEEYADACCLATDANGNKLNSIKFLYPSDTTNTGADLFGELFKSSELPQILNSGTIDTIVMTKTDPSDMSVVSTIDIDIKDIREYYLKYKDIPGAKSSILDKCFKMLSTKVEEAMK